MQHLKVLVLLFSTLLVTASPIAQADDCDSTDSSVVEPTSPVYTSYTEPVPTGAPGSGDEGSGGSTTGNGTDGCTAGAAMCCQSVATYGEANEDLGGLLDGLLGVVGGDLVGIRCSAIPIIGGEW